MNKACLLDTETVLNMDLNGLKLIEASAGTGKTYTIANLYLRHILLGRRPSQILVVTFTKAATEELRGRIRLRLFQALEMLLGKQYFTDEFLLALLSQFKTWPVEIQQKQIHRLRHALAVMDQNAISTIHSFCQRIIQDHALPGLQYFDNEILIDESELWQKAINDWWRSHTYELDGTEWSLFNKAIKNYDYFKSQINHIRFKARARLIPENRLLQSELFTAVSALEPELEELAVQWTKNRQFVHDCLRASKALSRKKDLPYHKDNIDVFLDSIDNYFRSHALLPIPDELTYLSHGALKHNSTAKKRGSDEMLEHAFFHAVSAIVDKQAELLRQSRPAIIRNAFEDCKKQVLLEKNASQLLSYQDLIDFVLQAVGSESGSQLASVIRTQYPVAMIDEFQDTDASQYKIFSTIYFDNNDISLTLIGDPKQAIYSFRGGDIFTYMQARQIANSQQLALTTNWRSQPALVNAINHFFSYRNDPFIFSGSIEFLPVNSADRNISSVLEVNSQVQTALTLWQIPSDENDKPLSKEIAGELLNRALTAEIVTLLTAGQNNRAKVEGRPLRAGDIAILVRTASQGESVRKELDSKGIAAITIGKDRVFDSDEATGLSLLLNAVAYPSNRRILRQSLGSQLLYFNHREMLDISTDEATWQQWIEDFQQLHNVWLARGFIPMFQQMMQTFGLVQKLAKRDQAERRLTNLLHLGELLQQQSLSSNGMDNLLNWFHQQCQDNSSEEAELRLESDDSLVKIITIHKSKGLEFPVVFLPYLWSCYPVNRKQEPAVYFHNDNLEAVLDLGSDNIDHHYLLADRERLAEDIRLLYVALTRAQSKVYLAWGETGSRSHSGNSSETAIAYLLHSKQTPDELRFERVNGISTPQTLTEELLKFVDQAAGNIELRTLPLSHSDSIYQSPKQATEPLQTREFVAKAGHNWRIGSFSSLTQDIHQPLAASERDPRGDPILNFPAGSRVGLFLHCVFEHLDFCADIKRQCLDLLARYAPKFGLGLELENRRDDLIHWINEVVHTDLVQPGLQLSVISNQQRLNELAFDFAADHVDIEKINRFFRSEQTPPQSEITVQDFRGLITGIIDMVFEYEGKYYLADYKSNYLGNRLQDYDSGNLHQAMLDRRYDLQLALYSLALHRYLRQRICNYRYEDHFGGAYYLFLRAMRRNDNHHFGVYFERPSKTAIESFDALMSFQSTVFQP